MRFKKAVERLRTIADECERIRPLWTDEVALTAVYTFGEVLEYPDELPFIQIALVVDRPAEELTWGAQPEYCEAVAQQLRLDKAPVGRCWRPEAWPVWNHVIKRPLLIWSTDGPNGEALDALVRRDADSVRLPAPQPEHEREQLEVEFEACLAHLRKIEQTYWEQDWRRDHRGFGIYPENHLWNAVHGYLDLLTAVRSSG